MSASANSRMVYPSGTDSPGWSQTKVLKTVVVVVVVNRRRLSTAKQLYGKKCKFVRAATLMTETYSEMGGCGVTRASVGLLL